MHDILDHLLSRIGEAVIDREPYPRFYVEEVFPPAFYAELRERVNARHAGFPPKEGEGESKDADGSPHRHVDAEKSQVRLRPADGETLDDADAEFWRAFADTLESEAFAAAVLARLGPHVKLRLGAANGAPIGLSAVLVRHGPGYELGVHTDSPTKLVSLIFYLPGDDATRHLGTAVCEPRDRGFRSDGNGHFALDGFEVIETAPFLPNSMFGFVKTDASFHAVPPLNEPGIYRDTLAYNLTLG